MTKKDLTDQLEPTGTNGEAQLVTGRKIDLSVAISLKRIADSLDRMSIAMGGGGPRTKR